MRVHRARARRRARARATRGAAAASCLQHKAKATAQGGGEGTGEAQGERAKLLRNLAGIREMGGLPDVMVVVDSHRESIAIAEGNRLGIPIVAMTDSNADPLKVAYPVASNDDAVRSIKIILQHLVEPVTAALESTGRAPRKK
jgi:ribosomal protein S2